MNLRRPASWSGAALTGWPARPGRCGQWPDGGRREPPDGHGVAAGARAASRGWRRSSTGSPLTWMNWPCPGGSRTRPPPRCCPTGGRNAAGGWPNRTWSSGPSARDGGCTLPQPRNWRGPGTLGRPSDTSAARSANGPATPITHSGHANDYPCHRASGQCRKVDAVAVLTGPFVTGTKSVT